MIAFRRTASVAPGMFSAAMALATELKTQVKATTGIDLQIAIQIGGNPNSIAWIANYESMAAFDSAGLKLLGDPKYQELIKKTAGLFVPDTTSDEVWRIV